MSSVDASVAQLVGAAEADWGMARVSSPEGAPVPGALAALGALEVLGALAALGALEAPGALAALGAPVAPGGPVGAPVVPGAPEGPYALGAMGVPYDP